MSVIGNIDNQIDAARWSPDGSSLIIVSGADELLKMTPDFDVLSEAPLRPAEFGAGMTQLDEH